MLTVYLLSALLAYQVGETYKVSVQRIGITLESKYTNSVCVYTSNNYNVFAVYDSTKILDMLNPLGNRLYLAFEGRLPMSVGDWNTRTWDVVYKDLSENTRAIRFYKASPINRSRWYFLEDFYFDRARTQNPSKFERFIVYVQRDSATSDTAMPIYDLQFHPDYADSIIYIAAGTGVFKGVAYAYDTTANQPIFYYWEWSTIPSTPGDVYPAPAYALLVLGDDNILAASDDGIYHWDGNSWTIILQTSKKVNKFFTSDNTGNIYALTDEGVYVYQGGNWQDWLLYGLEGKAVTSATLYGDTLLFAVLGEGVYQNTEGTSEFTTRNQGIEDRFYKDIGGLDAYSILATSNGALFLGTAVGLFQWIDGKWINIAGNTAEKTLGENLSTEVIDSALVLLEQNVDSAYNLVKSTISNNFQVPPDMVYPDYDNTPGINILLAPVFEYLNTESGIDIDYSPVWGYFDPETETDSTVNLKDYFVVNVSDFEFRGPRFLGLPYDTSNPNAVHKFLTFVLSRMAFWQADSDEDLFILTGLSIFNTWLAGIDVHDGLISGYEFVDNFNRALDKGSDDHPKAVEFPEVDRERMFLFFEYLYEKYGLDIIKELASDPANGYNSLNKTLMSYGDSLDGILTEWAFANFYDDTTTYGYRNLDINVNPVAGISTVQSPTIDPVSTYFLQAVGTVDSTTGTITYYMSFNAVNDAAFDVYRLDGGPTLQELDPETKSFSIIETRSLSDPVPTWCVVNTHSTSYLFAFAQDTTPPVDVNLYVLQNTVFNPIVDFFADSKEKIYYDVGVESPTIRLTNMDSGEETDVPFFVYAQSETTYIYNAHTELQEPGIYALHLIASDEIGNFAMGIDDTIGVLMLSPGGGILSFDNGNLHFIYPEGAVNSQLLVLVDKLENDLNLDIPTVVAYRIGSGSIILSKSSELRIHVDNLTKEKIGLYRIENRVPVPVPYTMDGDEIVAQIDRLGVYALLQSDGIRLPSKPLLVPLSQRIYQRTKTLPITFMIPKGSQVDLSIYDVAGRMKIRLYRGMLKAGAYTLKIPPNKLTSGMYFVKLMVNKKSISSEKFILQ